MVAAGGHDGVMGEEAKDEESREYQKNACDRYLIIALFHLNRAASGASRMPRSRTRFLIYAGDALHSSAPRPDADRLPSSACLFKCQRLNFGHRLYPTNGSFLGGLWRLDHGIMKASDRAEPLAWGGGILLDGEYAIRLSIQRVENGQYLATSNDLAGLVAQGRTIAETVEIAQDVARKLLESYREHGDPIPVTLKKIADRVELDMAVST